MEVMGSSPAVTILTITSFSSPLIMLWLLTRTACKTLTNRIVRRLCPSFHVLITPYFMVRDVLRLRPLFYLLIMHVPYFLVLNVLRLRRRIHSDPVHTVRTLVGPLVRLLGAPPDQVAGCSQYGNNRRRARELCCRTPLLPPSLLAPLRARQPLLLRGVPSEMPLTVCTCPPGFEKQHNLRCLSRCPPAQIWDLLGSLKR